MRTLLPLLRARVVLLFVGLLAVLGLWAHILTTPPSPAAWTPPALAADASSPPEALSDTSQAAVTSIAVLGDGFTAPTASGGSGAAGWPDQMSKQLGLKVTVVAGDGQGYVAKAAPRPLPGYAGRVVAAKPDVVVVEAGFFDLGKASPQAVQSAATALFADLRRQLPATRLVVVGPIWPSPFLGPSVTQLRDAVSAAAKAVPGTAFIDPVAERWFMNAADGSLLGPDHIHPNDAGHSYLARQMVSHLRALDIGQRDHTEPATSS